jgi:hypothetical protein
MILFFTVYQNGHLRESIDDQKNTIMTIFCGGKNLHAHGDKLLGLIWYRERSSKPLLLDGRLSDGIGNAQPDVLVDVMSKLGKVEMILKYYYYLIHPEVPCHPTVMCLPK